MICHGHRQSEGSLCFDCRQYVAAFSSDLWNIPTHVDHVLDGRVVQMPVVLDALCEQRWSPGQQPGKKSGHIFHLLCHQGSLGTACFNSTAITCASGLAATTPRHRQAQLLWCRERVEWRVEWRSVVFSDESRFCP